jgi:hypothetical protein
MKKFLTLATLISLLALGCTKQQSTQSVTAYTDPSTTSRRTVDYTNPDPTWIQVISPILKAAIWGSQFVPAGYAPGVNGPYDADGKVIVLDTTVVVKWHLHVGLRNFNSQLKADVVDYRYFYINGVQTAPKPIPNGGVQGDYDFIDTVKIIRNGYYNGYFPSETNYNWNGITPGVHSKATNGWIDNPFFVGILK